MSLCARDRFNCSALGQRPKLLAAGRPRPPRAHAPRGPGSHSFFLVLVGLFSYFVYSVSNPRSIPNPNLFLAPYPKQKPSPPQYKYPSTPPSKPSNQHLSSPPPLTAPPHTRAAAPCPRRRPTPRRRSPSPETSPEVAPRLFSSDRFLLIVPILFFSSDSFSFRFFSKPFRFSRSVFRFGFLLRNPRSDSFSFPI